MGRSGGRGGTMGPSPPGGRGGGSRGGMGPPAPGGGRGIRGGGPPMSHYGPSSGPPQGQGGRGMTMNSYQHGRGPMMMMGRGGPPLMPPHNGVGRGSHNNVMGGRGDTNTRRDNRGPNFDFGRHGPGPGGGRGGHQPMPSHRFQIENNRGPPPPPPPPPPPHPRMNTGPLSHQMQPAGIRCPPLHPSQSNNVMPPMNMYSGPPLQVNQQQQPLFPPGGAHLQQQQPFLGQYNQQQMQMNQSLLQAQHQQQILPGMSPPNQHSQMQHQQQQQQHQSLFSQNGQPRLGQFAPPHHQQMIQIPTNTNTTPQVISPHHTQQHIIIPMQQQQQQNVMAASLIAPTTTSAALPTADGWSEHRSPEGVIFYYNTITRVSTYERPTSLLQTQQNGAAAVTTTPTPTATLVSATSSPSKLAGSSTSSSSSTWNTYTDQTTGKKYYSNGITTTWTRPPELGPDDEIITTDDNIIPASANKRSTASVAASSEIETVKKKRRSGEKDDDVSFYANKAEAVAAFKGLLLAKDIAPTTKWADVVRMCSDDARWQACNTIGERKQALAEYQTKRSNELRDVKRQEKVRAKEAYQRLLNDILPTIKTFSPGASRFMDVRDFLSKDDRFYAVDDESTREELFYDFVEEMRKREERSKRSKKREAKESFLSFLKLREEEGKLTFASTWMSFLSSLIDEEKNDPRLTVSTNMSDSDRQLYFSDYVIELQNAEDEKRRRIRDARRRAEKAQRDAYREKLIEFAKLGTIIPSTHWRSVEDKIASDPCYEPVLAQGRDVPMEIFNDFVDDWSEQYRRDRSTLSRLWEPRKNELKLDEIAEEVFSKKLLDYSADSPDIYGDIRRMSSNEPLSSIRLFFNELKASSGEIYAKKRHNLLGIDDSSEDEGEIIEEEG